MAEAPFSTNRFAVANPIPSDNVNLPFKFAYQIPGYPEIVIRAYEDQWADLRSANQLASVMTERKPISKYA